MRQQNLTYNRLIIYIIATSLLFSLVSTFAYSFYLKKHAIEELAKDEAKKTSLFVFESLYSAMSKGIDKEELTTIIGRLNRVDTNLDIEVYRSQKVADLFGDEPQANHARNFDSAVIDALNGREQLHQKGEDYIRYLYPIVAQSDCLKCHTNVKPGEINGVIDLKYNITNIRISLNTLTKSLITFFIFFMVIIFLFIYANLKKNVVNPLDNFIVTIKSLMSKNDLSRRVKLDTRISEIKDIESFFNLLLESLQKQFYTDSLTGLKNRREVFEVINRCNNCAVAIINIDSFNQINDFYGNKVGDLVLIKVADIIKEILSAHPGYTPYRLGSDEYAVIRSDLDDLAEFQKSIRLILKRLEEKFTLEEGEDISLNVTGGAAIGGEDVLIKAGIALKSAKKSKKSLLFYEEGMYVAEEYENNIKWTNILKEAIRDKRLTAYYQPIVNNATGRIEKYETLVRLIEKDGSVVSPFFFLDVAKKSKLYSHITQTVIDNAFDTFKNNALEFSINLSVNDILDPETNTFIKHKISNSPAAGRAVFELLESEGIENYKEVIEFIDFVKQYGCKVAVDDFGTGYSNFEHLLELKVDYIKIDAAMIKNIAEERNSELVTETIVDFAKKLGIKTIAEYVHNEEVFEKVKDLGVDYSQGYHFGKPESSLKALI